MSLGTFLDISMTINVHYLVCELELIIFEMIKLGASIFINISIPISVPTIIENGPLMAKLIKLLMSRHQSFSGCYIVIYTSTFAI